MMIGNTYKLLPVYLVGWLVASYLLNTVHCSPKRHSLPLQSNQPRVSSGADWPIHIRNKISRSWPLMLLNTGTLPPHMKTSCVQDGIDCPYNNTNLIQQASDLNTRSTSPWVWVLNVDTARWPERIHEACCVCTRCVNFTTGTAMADYYSMPVTTRLPVGVRVGDRTELSHMHVAVGCTCALPAPPTQ